VVRIADVLALDLDLVVFAVHEHVHRILEVRIRDFPAFELNHVEFLVGAIDRLRPGSGKEVLEFHLDDGRVAAGFVEFGLLHDHRIVADHDHVAGADFLCGFHG
jgi:hypothetical protein